MPVHEGGATAFSELRKTPARNPPAKAFQSPRVMGAKRLQKLVAVKHTNRERN